MLTQALRALEEEDVVERREFDIMPACVDCALAVANGIACFTRARSVVRDFGRPALVERTDWLTTSS